MGTTRTRRSSLAALLAASLAACASSGAVAGVDSRAEGSPAAGPSLFRVILPVSGIEEAARFYGQVLGAPGVRISPGRHYFHCGDTILACFDPRADRDGYEPRPLPEWLYFAVDDVQAAFERCRAAGATPEAGDVDGTPAGEVARRPWGEVSFYVRDPFGNGICFVERDTAFTGR